jgi:peptidase C39-like protein
MDIRRAFLPTFTPALGAPPGTIFPGGDDTMPMMYQGASNGCGTTCLAMILGYLGSQTVDRHDIDAQIRRYDVFSAPDDLIGYARGAGFAAEGYNHGTQAELQRFIDAGIPCQLLISADGSRDLARLHMVVAVGYHQAGGETVFTVKDPVRGKIDVRWSDLERKWAAPAVGFDHYFIAVARPNTTLPPGRKGGIEGTLRTADGLAAVMNNFHRLAHPTPSDNPLAELGAIEQGVEQALAGAAEAVVSLASDAAEDARAALERGLRRLFG